ncbi:MAG: carboxypeptidase regulatory-like domain-containing protein [Candidatus Firestonebacteria bacterium]|nr:carboxypeptidase regulatory-like domain-containing protein [Candidatus Firestonebacteria bacterium]
MKPKESQVRLFSFLVPISASSGQYELTYFIGSQREYEINESVKFFIDVSSLEKIEVIVEDYSKMIIAGEIINIQCRLINRGNNKARIELELNGDPNYLISIESNVVILEAGTNKIINFKINTDKNLKIRTKYILNINALTKKQGIEKSFIADSKTLLIDIMPKISGDFDPYHRIPSKIKFINISEDDKNRFQIEFSGKGSINEKGDKKIEYLIRQPNVNDEIPFGDIEETFMSYSDMFIDLHLGDKAYSLSPLLEEHKLGRGAEIVYHPEYYTLGMFNIENKFDQNGEKELGLFFKYNFFDNKFGLKTNFLNKDKDKFSDKFLSVQTNLNLYEKSNINFELAANSSDREKNFKDNAYSVNFNGKPGENVFYNFTKTRFGPNFYGFYRDYDALSGKINFPINFKIKGNIGYNEYRNNLNLDTTLNTSAAYEKNYTAGIIYAFSSNINTSFDYLKLQSKDNIMSSDFDYEENAIKLGMKFNFDFLGINVYAEKGNYYDKVLDLTNNDLEKYSFFTYFSPGSNQNYSFFINTGHNSFISVPIRTKSAGVSSSWQFNRDAYLRIEYQKNNFHSEALKEQNYVFSNFLYTFPNNNSLYFRSTWSDNKDSAPGTMVYLGYSINWGIPIVKKQGIGNLMGIVYDAEKPGKIPLPNVLLLMDDMSAVTNQNGEFIFPSLSPRTYNLWVEKIFIGLDRVTIEKLPIPVEVHPGVTTNIEIGVVTSARIFGKLSVFAQKNDLKEATENNKDASIVGPGILSSNTSFDSSNYEEVEGLKNIQIELTNGKEIMQHFTDNKGEFSFRDLRPGNWTIIVSDANLPEYHYLENKEIHFELKPGEIKDVEIRVLPKIRYIRIIEEGEIKQEKR